MPTAEGRTMFRFMSKIGPRLMAVAVVFGVGVAVMYTQTDAKLDEQAADGALVNLSGRQRMLNQRHMKEVLVVANGGEANFQGTRNLFLSTNEALLDGGEAITNPAEGTTIVLPPATDPELRAAIEASQAGFRQIVELTDGVLAGTASDGDLEQALGLVQTTHADANAAVGLFQASAESKLESVRSTLLSVGVAVVLVALVALVLVTRSITGPLRRVVDRARVVGQGTVDDALLGMTGAGEIGELGRAFDDMQQVLARRSDELTQLADGHTTLEIEPLGEEDSVGAALQALVARLAEVADVLERIADEDTTARIAVSGDHDSVGNSARRLLEVTQAKIEADAQREQVMGQLNTYSAQLAAASEELAASSSEVTTVAEQTERFSSEASSAGSEVNEITGSVRSAVEGLAETADDIAGSAHEAAKKATEAEQLTERSVAAVAQLDEVSQNIGEVIDVIRNIAEQTNLLALNAAIEAARAGDAGRGFAVVAAEVKGLAEESGKSIDLIAQRVEEVQHGANETVSSNGEVASLLQDMAGLVRSIASAVEVQTGTTADLSERVERLAEAAQSISDVAASVDDAASTTRQASGESMSAAQGLADLANDMIALTER